MTTKPIYLDYNATTPIDPAVAEAMKPYLSEFFGNPSSAHWFGSQAKRAVEQARAQVASLLGCESDELVFTSGGSEANNLAIKGVAEAYRTKGDHIITSSIEHPAVMEVCRYLETQGFRVTYLPVDSTGRIDVGALQQAIRPETILVTIMHANNEVGTIQPIERIASVAHEHHILVHTDAAQSAGKIPVDVNDLGVDLLTVAGHKLYAPKGIGALYARHGTRLVKLIHGADHERDIRAGTENVLEIVGLGKACEMARTRLADDGGHCRKLRDRLYEGLKERLPEIRLNGHLDLRLPNTVSVSFPGVEANTLLAELEGVAASAGAACHADDVEISHVLEAMEVPREYAMGTIRFSTGRMTTENEITTAIDEIADVAGRLLHGGQPTHLVSGEKEIKLTHYTHGLGCACKLRPQALERVLATLSVSRDANLLVGPETSDDAAVYRLDDGHALVQTVDFFTPVVDDPYTFGAIAAANALSDIYAMGGTPLFALNIVGFPSNRLPMSVLEDILRGAQDKAKEAGISIVGGHTVDDIEPKYGLVVTGLVDPGRILTNSGCRPGDLLVLTKPLGVGLISTAIKRGLTDRALEDRVADIMGRLNKDAAHVMGDFDVSGCTDVTGFGLLGHLREMSRGSKVDVEIWANAVPFLKEARDFAASGVVPGGTLNNLEYVEAIVSWGKEISRSMRLVLSDAQTSGGLLIAVTPAHGDRMVQALRDAGVHDATIIGLCTTRGEGRIHVTSGCVS